MSKNDTSNSSVSRRTAMKIGGMALVGVWGGENISAFASQQGPGAAQPGKPLILAPADANDAAVHSRVENLFWCDVMMEHAGLFATLMPGAGVTVERSQAETFRRTFQTQSERAKAATFDRTNYAAFNRSTMELIKPFIEYKHRMREAQESGKIRTLVFPLFFDHTAREAERAVTRLNKLADGDVILDYSEVVDFWAAVMSDHAGVMAHMLDPQEQDLVNTALDSSALFKGLRAGNRDQKLPGGEIVLATEELIDFETTVQDGVNSGRIKSILDPILVDHMLRETLKFVDELKRTAGKT